MDAKEEKRLRYTRNIGIMAHIDAGKTTTTERILFYTKKTHRMGEVHEGNTIMDWMEEERKRGITITAAATAFHWKDYYFNLIDTPGHVDFTIEVERSLRVLDGAIIAFDGVAGVEPQTETVWRQANKHKVPRVCFINKLDRVGASFDRCVELINTKLDLKGIAIQLPIGAESDFVGIVDLINLKAYYWDEDNTGEKYREDKIPESLTEKANQWREKLVETLSEYDDSLMEKYLSGDTLSPSEIINSLRKSVIHLKLSPVLCGSAFKNKGVQLLLDAVINFLPCPLDIPDVAGIDVKNHEKTLHRKCSIDESTSALAFKIASDQFVDQLTFVKVYSGKIVAGQTVFNSTKDKRERVAKLVKLHANKREEVQELMAGDIGAAIGLKVTSTGDTLCDDKAPILLEKIYFPEPVIQIAVEPKSASDYDKLKKSLERLALEDPSFRVRINEETNEVLISGMGELHLEIIVNRLKNDFKVDANIGKPQVSYRETIKKTVREEGEFIRESNTASKGQYGHCFIEIQPGSLGSGAKFENKVPEVSFPKKFAEEIFKGIQDSATSGALSGYPVVDYIAKLISAKTHPTDSNELAYRIAGSQAMTEALRKAQCVLLEPVMKVEISTPDSFLGDCISDVNSRRGKVNKIDAGFNAQIITAEVPLASMFGYSTQLRNFSQGRASYSMEFSHYSEVPPKIVDELLNSY